MQPASHRTDSAQIQRTTSTATNSAPYTCPIMTRASQLLDSKSTRRQTLARSDGTQLSVHQTKLTLVRSIQLLVRACCLLTAPWCALPKRHFTACAILHVTCEFHQAERHLRAVRLRQVCGGLRHLTAGVYEGVPKQRQRRGNWSEGCVMPFQLR